MCAVEKVGGAGAARPGAAEQGGPAPNGARVTWLAEEKCPSERGGWINEWTISNPCIHGGHIRRITKQMAVRLLQYVRRLHVNIHDDRVTVCYVLVHPRYWNVSLVVSLT